MVDSTIIYKVIVNFQTMTGMKAIKTIESINKLVKKMNDQTQKTNKGFQTSAIRLFSLIFLLRRMRDGVANMLKPAADMAGLFDVLNMTLGLFFLPIMLALLDPLLWFSEWLLSLPDSVKVVIGIAALLVVGLLSLGIAILAVNVGLAAMGGGSAAAGLTALIKYITTATAATTGLGAALKLAFGVGIVAAIIGMCIWLYNVQEKMGGLWNFALNFAKGILRIFAFIGAGIAGVFAGAWDLVKQGWNLFVQFLEDGLNQIIGWINSLIDAFNFVTGANVDRLSKADFSGAKATSVGFANAFGSTVEDLMASYFDWEQKNLATPTLDQVKKQQETDSRLQNIQMMKDSGMSNADIINAMAGGKNGLQTTGGITVNQTNTYNVSDWQALEKKNAEEKRKLEADLKRLIASSQV